MRTGVLLLKEKDEKGFISQSRENTLEIAHMYQ